MKRTILITLVTICLAIPPAWGECGSSSCNDNDHPDNEVTEAVPAAQDQSAQPKYKVTPRGAAISDFVTPGRSAEKDCEGAGCGSRTPVKPLEQPRVPEKKCATENC